MPSTSLHFHGSKVRSIPHHILPEYCDRQPHIQDGRLQSTPYSPTRGLFVKCEYPFLIVPLPCLSFHGHLISPGMDGVWDMCNKVCRPTSTWTVPARVPYQAPVHWAASCSRTHHTFSSHQDFAHAVPSALKYLTSPTPPVSMQRTLSSMISYLSACIMLMKNTQEYPPL